MSPYGTIPTPVRKATGPLLPRSYALAKPGTALTVFPSTRDTVPQELVEYLAGVFNDVVEEGRTYPTLGKQSVDEFSDYFFSADCFVGLLDVATAGLEDSVDGVDRKEECSIESVRKERDWKECVLGMFYVKPNYPGRSSHLCNGGFVVPSHHRGLRVGSTLGRAYLHFAPLLGYRGSVFNLVYVSNVASVKIWDNLGFKRQGLIPGAGRLKSLTEGGEDEFVDAIVFFKSFVEEA